MVRLHGSKADKVAAALTDAEARPHTREPCIVLAQTRDTCKRLNRELQRLTNPPSPSKPELWPCPKDTLPWRLGDLVVATTSEKSSAPPHASLFVNGDQGTIVHIDKERARFHVDFGGQQHSFPVWTDDLLHAWAMTVHRYQGSESAHAIVVMDMCTQFQTREALYTAVTRGAKTVSLHSNTTTLRAALGRSSRACRVTKLCERVSSALAKRKREG